jgi:hypothetical protein
MAGVSRTAFTFVALAIAAMETGCAFPLSPPLESCQRLSQCPVDKRDILYQINAGGPEIAPFAADTLFTDGVSQSDDAVINVSQADDPAPPAVYQSYRYASDVSFQYTFTQLDPTRAHFIRLHFADTVNSEAGEQIFDVDVNGELALNQVDIILEAGGPDKALIREFGASPDDQGVLRLDFISLPAKGVAQVCAIEIWRPK